MTPRRVDARTDTWQLATLLFFLISKKFPFALRNPNSSSNNSDGFGGPSDGATTGEVGVMWQMLEGESVPKLSDKVGRT